MKLLILACLAVVSCATQISNNLEWIDIDWSQVVPIEETPGFWDGREIRPATFEDRLRASRIVGGQVVTPHSHPYQAALLLSRAASTAFCGGSLIGTNWALTAAHCSISSTDFQVQVILGAHEFRQNEPNQQRFIVPGANIRNHPSYNPSNLNNDIALLGLPTPAVPTTFVSAISLPALGRGDAFAGLPSVVSGWGRIVDGVSGQSQFLMSVDNQIITNTVCAATYGNSVVFDGVICTSTVGGRGPCQGDSGGPLTIGEAGGRTQVGVTAFVASSGCSTERPAGFARVSHFRQWILNESGI